MATRWANPIRPALPATESPYNPTRPHPNIKLQYAHALPNAPGLHLVSLLVTFPPNASTPPHRHPAFVAVNVIKGWVFNGMNDEPIKVFGPVESFHEGLGCRHRVSDNASETEEAVIIATMVVESKIFEDGGVEGLVLVDEEWKGIGGVVEGKGGEKVEWLEILGDDGVHNVSEK